MLIIQARVGSARLPGKVLLPLGNTTVIGNVINACKKSGEMVVVAIPDTEENKPLAAEILKHDVDVFYGDEDDVLSRYYHCAKKYEANYIVRVTADCPFINPGIIKRVVAASRGNDYGSNLEPRTFPKGLDCEYFSFDMLEKAHRHAKEPYDREHVTPYIKREALFKIQLTSGVDISPLNWCIDTAADYEYLNKGNHRYDLDKMRSQ